jgi:predicted GNAT superfamily acetyltransferase
MVSQRMAVLPEYRGGGLGNALKLAQRDCYQALGIPADHWTFDPLNNSQRTFEHPQIGLYSASLRAQLLRYAGSPLVSLGQSDRLVADWRILHWR